MNNTHSVDVLVQFYEHLSPESVSRFPEFYSANAYFKDPFNEVHGLAPIQGIFMHMFDQVSEPRFIIAERIIDGQGALLVWDFHYQLRRWGRDESQRIHGVSHLKFDTEGKVIWHRDYWDAAEELYARLPFIGGIMRGLKKLFSTPRK